MEEQMKSALKYFQLSSDAFSFLKDYVNTNSLSVDFEPALLACISWLMLAQAAELAYLKSASFKDEVAAKVAAYAADYYKEAYTLVKTESSKKAISEVGRFAFAFSEFRDNRTLNLLRTFFLQEF
ncbi:unnamed protein product [Rotaria sp. Silwood2]|nr:unnamed protein product [Rotaria sp. Silwood2]CAF3203083.1 unnamed protein product [Rotaria sp. Silwood2]CAF3374608.1 unnamed protein product [Rotaria sp. Silwood2]CAF3463292.1 unnamed protein product [Rotaria sp. Silwood2]CAF4386220.1 unnamed protein product [Rotaria sp. Silwood2]